MSEPMRPLAPLLRAVLLALVLWLGPGFAALAQGAPDYEAWQVTAKRAEEAIEADRASDAAMASLRAQLSNWREQFADAQSVNAKTIQTVEAQLAALGPAPENGEEPEDIAAQRQQLNDRLNALRAPAKTAEVAFSRADGLISAIDGILRERQAEELLARGSTPLNPTLWQGAWGTLLDSLGATAGEVGRAWGTDVQREELRKNLPEIIVLLVIAIIGLALGRRYMLRLSTSVQARRPTPTRWLIAFGLSLGQVVIPLVGLVALIQTFYRSGLVGLRLDPLLAELAGAGLLLFVALWLGVRVFPKAEAPHVALQLTPERRREGRLITGLVGLLLASDQLLVAMAGYDSWSEAVRAVVFFPMIVLGGVLIWRLGALLRAHGDNAAADEKEAEDDGGVSYTAQIFRLVGRVLVIVAFIGPSLAAAGYLSAGRLAVFPVLQSFLLMAFLMVVQRVFSELWVLLRRREDVRDGLVPMLAGFGLILAASPLFALIWGVSEAQIGEFFLRINEGVQVGDSRIGPTAFLIFAVIFAVGYLLTRLIQGALKNTVLPKTRIDVGGRNALVSGVGYVGIFLAAVMAITSAGIDLSSLALVAGALSVGIGFGLQNIVSNFVSGIILLIERPISEGDWIEVGGNMGYVRDISVRSTRIETFDRTDVIVPNSDFVSGTVTNYTRGNTVGRVIVSVGVAYGTDTRSVEKILREIAEGHPMVMLQPPPGVIFQGFGADSLDFEIRAILRDVNWVLSVKSEMNHEIAKRFAEEGIEIPFAQRDVWLRNPEALRGEEAPAAAPEAGPGDEGDDSKGETRLAGAHLDEDDMDIGPDGGPGEDGAR